MFLSVTIAKLVRGVYYSQRSIPFAHVDLINRTKPVGASSDCKRFVYTTRCLWHGEYEWRDPKNDDEIVNVTFVDKDGKRVEVKGKIGDNVLYLAHR